MSIQNEVIESSLFNERVHAGFIPTFRQPEPTQRFMKMALISDPRHFELCVPNLFHRDEWHEGMSARTSNDFENSLFLKFGEGIQQSAMETGFKKSMGLPEVVAIQDGQRMKFWRMACAGNLLFG